MSVTPMILGKGRAGHAIAESLAILSLMRPELKLQTPLWLERGAALATEREKHQHAVLCIANPHGLHADAIIEASAAGFDAILCEKPACVSLDQLQKLQRLSLAQTPTAIFHVYRQMWGPQTVKQMILDGQFGDIISIEGRYWQASTAERALNRQEAPSAKGWKDDTRLSGEFDAYLDVGTHWVDAVSFLFGAKPERIQGWRSYANAESSHRDSHVQLTIEFPEGRAFGSISKTFHGAMNHFELNVIGSRKSATWEFLKPDEIVIGEGRDRRVLTRKDALLGAKHPPHHGLGWLEGYVEITSRLLAQVYEGQVSQYPTLQDNLALLVPMLKAEWR